jgi:hypothetical protein
MKMTFVFVGMGVLTSCASSIRVESAPVKGSAKRLTALLVCWFRPSPPNLLAYLGQVFFFFRLERRDEQTRVAHFVEANSHGWRSPILAFTSLSCELLIRIQRWHHQHRRDRGER